VRGGCERWLGTELDRYLVDLSLPAPERRGPWGRVEVHEGARVEYNLRWAGHYLDSETGLHYNRYRYYDPGLGRYLTHDPMNVW
jgi:RHS repeat-associated protein